MPSAIIVGASSGIGLALATQLCARGWRVGIAARNHVKLAEISNALGPDRCLYRAMDVSDLESAMAGFAQLDRDLGGVEAVYLVAGAGFLNPDLLSDLEATTVAVNCAGFAALAGAAVRLFAARGAGHLIGITSVAAIRPSGQAPAYGASKSFGSSYLEGLRYWIARRKLPIHVTEIRPGFVDTPMMKVKKPIWLITADQAAVGILAAVARRPKVAYVPRRWRWAAVLLRILPDAMYTKLGETAPEKRG